MTDTTTRKRLSFRAWHRGTREADFMIGGFYDRYGATWNADELAWFADFLEEDDVEIMGWALGTASPPAHLLVPEFAALKFADFAKMDYIHIP